MENNQPTASTTTHFHSVQKAKGTYPAENVLQ